jgi:hypothetical protein
MFKKKEKPPKGGGSDTPTKDVNIDAPTITIAIKTK